jgi:CDP-diacylglycerol--glycerol-3-phosphate 3-phosphatidyltransferase
MRITANHVTLLRLVFLPLPCALLFGGPWHKSLALVLFIVLGLTDYLDGYLARKQGPTTLGALIDPMADKIFVTAMFVPLAQLGAVPIWMVLLLFVREYVVTELRSIHGSHGAQFKTSELAKYKTTIQMIGGAVIIFNGILGDHWAAFVPLGGFFLFTLALARWTYLRHGRLGPRIITFVTLVGWALGMRAFFPYQTTNWAIMALVMGITLLSGIQYVYQTWRHLGSFLRRQPGLAQWASFVGIGFAFPAIYLSALSFREAEAWIIILVLSLEFATGGLNNLLATLRARAPYIPPTTKIIILNAAGLLGLAFLALPLPGRIRMLNALLFLGLLASLVYCARTFYLNRRTLFGDAEFSARTVA